MRPYLNLLDLILKNGVRRDYRTGTGTISVFGHQMRFRPEDWLLVVTSKKLHLRSIIYELLWFFGAETTIKYLKDHSISVWIKWDDANGDFGPVYDKQ